MQPIFGAGDNNGPPYPTQFDLLGVALAAWTLAAFAIGVLAGARSDLDRLVTHPWSGR